MLAIRMRRTGRKGHAQFRVIVQDSRFSPSSGRVVEYLGSYDPHAKTAALDKEKISAYLSNGAQPSDRASRLFKSEGIALPAWVKEAQPKKRGIRHPEKLRRNRPAEEPKAEAPADEVQAAAPAPAAENPETGPAEESPPAETTQQEPAVEDAVETTAEENAEPEETANQAEEPAEAADKPAE